MPADTVQRVHGFRAWATCSFIGMCMLACLVAKSCPNLCELMDCCPPGSSVHGILQARILECVAISSSTGSSWLRDRTLVSCVFCIDRQILYHWALRGAPLALAPLQNRLYFPSNKPVSVAGLHCARATGPKFGSVTTALEILTLCGEVGVNSVLDAWQVEPYLI